MHVHVVIKAFRALPDSAKASKDDMERFAASFNDPFITDVVRMLFACWNGEFDDARRMYRSLEPSYANAVFVNARKFRKKTETIPRRISGTIIRCLRECDDLPGTVAFMVNWFQGITWHDFTVIVILNTCAKRPDRVQMLSSITHRVIHVMPPGPMRDSIMEWSASYMAQWSQGNRMWFDVTRSNDTHECNVCFETKTDFIAQPERCRCAFRVCTECASKWIEQGPEVPSCPTCRREYTLHDKPV